METRMSLNTTARSPASFETAYPAPTACDTLCIPPPIKTPLSNMFKFKALDINGYNSIANVDRTVMPATVIAS